ncbi:peptide/nickel transport system ATP-binding protein [Microbacterium sp. W4I4]|uniref:dipeptide ABC transporter ATP-binding protein n=1 Tax=Microbacterium sp. W4I4 TaxID=3042295 RepID=UPI00277FAC8F|nr:ABC transporter ATP-binding protein [Microbacterium sp. W4I4]MDQ0614512.1 peptide/nickel transport system ATP-binding protein [Microbacterium sp. W4I4]
MSEALLTVEGLRVEYSTRGRWSEVVHGISFDVQPGKVVALVGESGSGKSTVSQALIRRLPENGRITEGAIRFAGNDLVKLPERALRKLRGAQIGFVPQDPGSSLNPLMRVGEQIAETLRIHRRMPRAAAAARAIEILDEVGIPQPALRAAQYPHELSGGLRQRALIGIAWACGPQFVIADEPTSALDVTVQRHVLDQLDDLVEQHGTAVLLITHDLAVAADRADEIIVMYRGEIVERGVTADVLNAPAHEYTRRLVAAAPGLREGRLAPQVRDAASRSDEGALFATFRERVAADRTDADSILEVRGISKSYGVRGGSFLAADDVSFAVPRGRTLSIVGESGSGKTTSARIAARLVQPDAGTILLDGEDITRAGGEAMRQLRRRMQVVYQNPFGSLDPRMTVERIVAEPLRSFRIGDRRSQRELVRELLNRVQLDPDLAARRPGELSGGQRQRVAIARALALGPDLLILDEPVSALDVAVQEQILQLLVDLQAEFRLSYLFISHDLGVVRQISDRIDVMQKGRVVESGDAAEVLERPSNEYTRELIAAIPGRIATAD